MHDIEIGVKIQPTWIPPWCRDAVIMASMLWFWATSLLRWLWQHICFHLVPYWMHKCVVFDLGVWLYYISSQVVVSTWMRFKQALLRRPLICIGTNNMFQLGMLITKWVLVELTKKFRSGHASDINLQDPQPAHPGANRPSLCWNWGMFVHVNPCNFLLMGTSYKIPILPTGWNCHGGL